MSQIEKRAFTLSLLAGLLIVCNAVAVGVAGAYFPRLCEIIDMPDEIGRLILNYGDENSWVSTNK